jgi:GntR family transcriptional regulator
MPWDPDGPEPIYKQLAAELRSRIASGVYVPNRRIPSEAQLSREFDVHRSTVRQALDILREQGLVIGVQGRGTFVTDNPPTDVDV